VFESDSVRLLIGYIGFVGFILWAYEIWQAKIIMQSIFI